VKYARAHRPHLLARILGKRLVQLYYCVFVYLNAVLVRLELLAVGAQHQDCEGRDIQGHLDPVVHVVIDRLLLAEIVTDFTVVVQYLRDEVNFLYLFLLLYLWLKTLVKQSVEAQLTLGRDY
jgi:hypothetical protein